MPAEDQLMFRESLGIEESGKNKLIDKLEVVSIADVFGESMKRIVEGTSLSSLFKGFN